MEKKLYMYNFYLLTSYQLPTSNYQLLTWSLPKLPRTAWMLTSFPPWFFLLPLLSTSAMSEAIAPSLLFLVLWTSSSSPTRSWTSTTTSLSHVVNAMEKKNLTMRPRIPVCYSKASLERSPATLTPATRAVVLSTTSSATSGVPSPQRS